MKSKAQVSVSIALESINAVIARETKVIGDARDRLRSALSDAEAIVESATEGIERLRSALDCLSEYL